MIKMGSRMYKKKIICAVLAFTLLFAGGCKNRTETDGHQSLTAGEENTHDAIKRDAEAGQGEEADAEDTAADNAYEAGDYAAYLTTEDYSKYYDDSPNTAEPRDYTEDEISLDIVEDTYVASVNEIYLRAEDYLGQMIRIEGMCLKETYDGKAYCYVYRHGPGCCSSDGELCGFEFTYNGDMPESGEWIEVVGTLRQYLEGDLAYLTLDAVSVKVKAERGAEEVTE